MKLVTACALCAIVSAVSAIAEGHEPLDIDLAIGRSETWNRPAVLIAWRNTFKVFEAEILVHNFGTDAGRGQISLEIVDEDGSVLMQRPGDDEAVVVDVPPYSEGGREGVVVQVLGSVEANQLIDRLDRDGKKYIIRAMVDSIEGEVDPSNNVNGKTYNSEALVTYGRTARYSFEHQNPTSRIVSYDAEIEMFGIPEFWNVSVPPELGRSLEFEPNEKKYFELSLDCVGSREECLAPHEGDIEVRLISLNDGTTHGVWEWYVAADHEPPRFYDDEEIAEVSDGFIHIEEVLFDDHSGIKEASGIKIEYSTDGGLTFSNRTMAYLDGDFKAPTRFLADLGPFKPETSVMVSISAEDSVGNRSRRDLGTFEIDPEESSLGD